MQGKLFYCWRGDGCEKQRQFESTAQLGTEPYDIAIVGAGVVGCALAYTLSQCQLRVLLCDKNFDVGEGTSKGNSAIIHTGFDAPNGSLEASLVTRASRRWPDLAEKLKIPLRQSGGLLLALDEDQAHELPKLREKALVNGVDDVEIIGRADVLRLEPNAGPKVVGGLLVPRESIVDPFTVPIAFAEVALTNGCDILLGCQIVGVEDAAQPVKTLVDHLGHRIRTRIVVNVAGLGSQQLAGTYAGQPYDINPRRGQFLLYDKNTDSLVSRILLPVPTAKTKGKLVSPTIFGNLLAGPTAEDLPLDQPDAAATTIDELAGIREVALRMCPALEKHRPVAQYAGLRCNCAQGSYQICLNDGGLTVNGVRSTGLTAAPALADHLTEQMAAAGWIKPNPCPQAVDSRSPECWPGWWRRPFDDAARIAAKPDYGRFLCFCESISKQEIIDALDSPLRPRTLDALKRRTRVLMGRCQGFNCRVRIAEMMSMHCGIPLEAITKNGPGSELFPAGKANSEREGAMS
jgi:glycerol-3-phosphate dehydrogenase